MPASTLTDQESASRTTMIGLLDRSAEALDGYPAAMLMRGCWRPNCAGVSVRGCHLAHSVLCAWIRQLDHDLLLLKPGAGAAIERIRQHVSATREALTLLLDCVAVLLSARPSAARALPQPAAAGPAPAAWGGGQGGNRPHIGEAPIMVCG